MELKVYKTYEISDRLWNQVSEGFNESFNLHSTPQSIRNSFCIQNRDGYGYHAIALSDEGDLMGYNVFSPVYYKNGLKTVVSGSTIVRPKYRKNELLFMDMVNALRNEVVKDGFQIEIGVPNHNSEKFALKILKFKPVAELNYYILPFNISRCFSKNMLSFLDGIIKYVSQFHILCQTAISTVFNTKEKIVKYEIELDDKYWNYRFKKEGYRHFQDGGFSAYWLPYNEDGIKAIYLMDFRQGKKRTYKSLIKALKIIAKTEDVDMILFVGFLHMKQFGLLKCPKKYVPKRLPLTYYVLNKSDKEKFSDMMESQNWNFSLMNFDVR